MSWTPKNVTIIQESPRCVSFAPRYVPSVCPFCQNVPTVVSMDSGIGTVERKVECITKGCALEAHLFLPTEWERRAPAATIPAELAALREGTPEGPWYECQTLEPGKFGIRNRGGILFWAWKPSKWEGQDERFKRETAEMMAAIRLVLAAKNAEVSNATDH